MWPIWFYIGENVIMRVSILIKNSDHDEDGDDNGAHKGAGLQWLWQNEPC